MGRTPNPAAITTIVNDAADAGATSFKAYTTLRSSELGAAIEAAHRRGFRVAGHLCAVGYREATALGIDSLEHGLLFDTDFDPEKQPDRCPEQGEVLGHAIARRPSDPDVQSAISNLVRHGVSITSTLAVLESMTGYAHALDPRVLQVLSPRLGDAYRAAREPFSDAGGSAPRAWARALDWEMQTERAFVAAGGRLMAGVDPTGWGGVVAGFGDQRGLELLPVGRHVRVRAGCARQRDPGRHDDLRAIPGLGVDRPDLRQRRRRVEAGTDPDLLPALNLPHAAVCYSEFVGSAFGRGKRHRDHAS